jgi:hypothetical protein
MKISIEIGTNEPTGNLAALVSEVLAAAEEHRREAAGDDALNAILNGADDAGYPLRVVTISGEYGYIRPSLAPLECQLTYTVTVTL